MSTRGYVTLIDEDKNIVLSAYLRSDAYPSYYGLQVLDALQSGTFPSFITQLREEQPDDLEMVDGITRDWYIKSSKTKNTFFHDYTYEYAPHDQKLNIYYFGDKALSIPLKDLSFYRELFQLDSKLDLPLRYDPVSCTLKKHYYPTLRAMLKAGTTLTDFQALSEQSVLYMDRGRLKDPYLQSDSFYKRVFDSKSKEMLTFYARAQGNRYFLSIQTPFYFAPVLTRALSSLAAVEKELVALIRDRSADLRGTMNAFRQLTEYKTALSAAFQNDEIPLSMRLQTAHTLKNNVLESLHQIQSTCTLLGNKNDSFSREIQSLFFDQHRSAAERSECTSKPPLANTIASADAKAQLSDQDVQGREVPPQAKEH